VQKRFWNELFCVLQVFLCALVSRSVRARARAQLTGNVVVGERLFSMYDVYVS